MIELKDGFLTFGEKQLFGNLSFSVGDGEIVGVAGGKGCGKTALLMVMLGLIPLDKGYVCVNGEAVTAATAGMFRKMMAYVPQDRNMCGIRVSDLFDILFGLKSHDETEYTRKRLFAEWKELQLDMSLFEQSTDSLEPSELQRALLSGARLADRSVVLLDEPLSDQNAEQSDFVVSCLRRMSGRGASVLLTMSDDRLLAVCDKIVILDDL